MYSFEKNISIKDEPEVWKDITYPSIVEKSYLISSYGRIKNAKTGKILKLYPLVRDLKTENIYYIIKLKSYTKSETSIKYKNFRVNRLVAWEFCENRAMIKIVMHLNNNKLDNYYKNLKWGTIGENTRDAFHQKLVNIEGRNNIQNVYDEEYIHYICKMMEDGFTNKEILLKIVGEKATIRKNPKEWSLIYHLRHKDRFTEIALQYNYLPEINVLPLEKRIYQLLFEGKENIDIMKIYGYNTIKDNTKLYSCILKCRKIIKICSTTRERQLLMKKIND